MSLETLAEQIRANLNDEARSADEYKWQRAGLYAQARRQFRSDKLFGQWITESFSTDVGRVDASNVIRKLLLCLEYLSEDEFMRLGYSKAAELMNKTMWNRYPNEMTELVRIGHEFTVKVLRQHIKDIKAGVANIQLPVPPMSESDVMRTVIDLYENRPSLPFEFSTNDRIREVQIKQLKESTLFTDVVFGTTRESEVAEYRRLSRLYHPDREGGSDELMAVLNEVKETLDILQRIVSRTSS